MNHLIEKSAVLTMCLFVATVGVGQVDVAAPAPDEPIYIEGSVQESAVFRGGDDALNRYIAGKVVYPSDAIEQNVQGKVWIEFLVEKDGSIADVSVSHGAHPLLDAEALRVVKNLPPFERPARMGGKPVRMRLRLPIVFKLK